MCSLDSPGAAARNLGRTPNGSDESASSKTTPSVGGGPVGDYSSPEEWVFPKLIKTTPPEGVNEIPSTGGDIPVYRRTLPDREQLADWVLSELLRSETTITTSSEEVLNRICDSALFSLPEDVLDTSVSVPSPLVAGVGVASGIGATPSVGDNGSYCSSGTVSTEEGEKADTGSKCGRQLDTSVSSTTSSGVSSGSSGKRKHSVQGSIVQSSLVQGAGKAPVVAKTGIPRVNTKYVRWFRLGGRWYCKFHLRLDIAFCV